MKIKKFNENKNNSLEDNIVEILDWEIYVHIENDECSSSDYEIRGLESATKKIIEYLKKNYPNFEMDLDAKKYNL